MEFGIELFSGASLAARAVDDILSANETSAKFGLVLSREGAVALAETRSRALSSCGRVEFGNGVSEKLITAFCDSPYISKDTWADTLCSLTEMFYYYKNETLDILPDDDLIKFMKDAFDGVCRGSLDLLEGRELANLARDLRFGIKPQDDESEEEGDDE